MTINRIQPNLTEGTRLGLDADPYGRRGQQLPTMQHTALPTATPISPTVPTGQVPGGGPPVPNNYSQPLDGMPPSGGVGTTGPTDSAPMPTTGYPPSGGVGTNGPTGPGTHLPLPPGGTSAPRAPSGPSGMDAGRRVTENELVSNQLNSLLNSNSTYIRNAQQRGREYAASRGMLNSSIGAGASHRAAIEAGLPIASADADAYRSAGDQTYAALNRLREIQATGQMQNWLSSESFNREFNGMLAMLPIRSSMDMLSWTTQRAMEDPAVYTPDVLSGFNNFFNQNMFDIMGRYFGTGSTPGGG